MLAERHVEKMQCDAVKAGGGEAGGGSECAGSRVHRIRKGISQHGKGIKRAARGSLGLPSQSSPSAARPIRRSTRPMSASTGTPALDNPQANLGAIDHQLDAQLNNGQHVQQQHQQQPGQSTGETPSVSGKGKQRRSSPIPRSESNFNFMFYLKLTKLLSSSSMFSLPPGQDTLQRGN